MMRRTVVAIADDPPAWQNTFTKTRQTWISVFAQISGVLLNCAM